MFSKVLLFASYLVIANAGALSGLHGATSYGVNTGFSTVSRTQDAHGNYAFGYDVTGHLGAKNSREERGDGYGNVMGSYTLADIDGRQRRVDYVADALGFRANVATNEPGTLPSATGAALVNGGAAAFKAPLIGAGLA
ncbi:Adult-specific rigid cuticular protein 15.5-like protein, partial [Leptotrombidium deliense]